MPPVSNIMSSYTHKHLARQILSKLPAEFWKSFKVVIDKETYASTKVPCSKNGI